MAIKRIFTQKLKIKQFSKMCIYNIFISKGTLETFRIILTYRNVRYHINAGCEVILVVHY